MRYLLHDVFTKTVVKYPSNIAIICENGQRITYRELDKLANQYAHLLLHLKQNTREYPYVGIISSVHANSIACILASLKIGCAYIPLDEYSPVERLKHIIKNTQLDVIAVDPYWYNTFSELFNEPEISRVILLDDTNLILNEKIISYAKVLSQPKSNIPVYNQVSDDLAYILHSSGSTGIPKGIMLTHRNARTFVDWMQKEFQIQQHDKIMSRAPLKFDLSIFDIFNTFNAGASLICYNWNIRREGNQKHLDYVDLLVKEKATILYTTPSTFISLLNRGNLGSTSTSLRTIMYAGEPFPIPHLRKLHSVLPHTKIANIYGPTETNIITYYWIDSIPNDDNASIPLGTAVEDTEIIVVNEEEKRLCAPCELGELWCRGGTVTIGYLGLEEKTKEHLVLSPFHKYPAYFWRTGDFGFRDSTGCLHYRGRKDHMIKVKGFRIEIGEVECAISGYPGIDEFVVVAKPDTKYGNRLYCYFSSINNQTLSIDDIFQYTKKKLPEYMIPYSFIQLEVLPKTSSGKIDRVSLQMKEL